ncbi:MAG: hypothetical protein ACXWE5_12135 [Actinomycetota bacterium]
MNPLLAVTDGVIFAIGGVIFIAVFTAALGLAYVRFAELGEADEPIEADQPRR